MQLDFDRAVAPSQQLLPESMEYSWNWILRVLDHMTGWGNIGLASREFVVFGTFFKDTAFDILARILEDSKGFCQDSFQKHEKKTL